MFLDYNQFCINAAAVRAQMAGACDRCGRRPDEVELLAVTKSHHVAAAELIEAARFCSVFKFLESLGQAVKTQGVQLFKRRMSKHEDFLSMVIAGTAHIGVVEQGGLAAVVGRRFVAFLCEKGGDALAVERAEFEGPG